VAVKGRAENRAPRPALLVWWVVWCGLLAGFLQAWYFVQPPALGAAGPVAGLAVAAVSAGFLALSAAVRWLLLPRIARAPVAFVFFLAGLGLAEACGYLGIFLGGARREPLAVAGLLGLLQFLPRFARRFFAPPAAAVRR
jgi:hypothetical protein